MNNMNFSQDKLDQLLKVAGKKLGQNPDSLKTQLESGNLQEMIGGLDPNTQSKISMLMQNPKALETVLQNEKIKKMLGSVLGGEK